ncbi:Lsr2 protein [Labedaea rhizosphaerae]|uniref:Lsr2 protein n=1 Tax=Labedaea rhizosphaerae TaxID=598644 RepID=A0A4R6SD30_LABRH|nr:Lsr2 protein [Labedaea rhizosphaerae]
MAQKTYVELVDDLDGSTGSDISTVEFGLDGVTYEIDINEDNAAALRESLETYIQAARRTGGRKRRGGGGSVTRSDRERTKAIRDWARANGHEVSERGRLSTTVVEAYEAATKAGAKPAAKGRRTAAASTPRATATATTQATTQTKGGKQAKTTTRAAAKPAAKTANAADKATKSRRPSRGKAKPASFSG